MASQKKTATVIIQVNSESGPVVPQGATEDFIRATQEKLKQVTEVVRTSWEGMVADISKLPTPPEEIGIEFGVDVGAEGGIPFITKGSIGANFKISLVWRK
jgi:hypothetical protein